MYVFSDVDRLHIADTDKQDDLGTQENQGQSSQDSKSQSQEEPESQPLIFSPSSDEDEGMHKLTYSSLLAYFDKISLAVVCSGCRIAEIPQYFHQCPLKILTLRPPYLSGAFR